MKGLQRVRLPTGMRPRKKWPRKLTIAVVAKRKHIESPWPVQQYGYIRCEGSFLLAPAQPGVAFSLLGNAMRLDHMLLGHQQIKSSTGSGSVPCSSQAEYFMLAIVQEHTCFVICVLTPAGALILVGTQCIMLARLISLPGLEGQYCQDHEPCSFGGGIAQEERNLGGTISNEARCSWPGVEFQFATWQIGSAPSSIGICFCYCLHTQPGTGCLELHLHTCPVEGPA